MILSKDFFKYRVSTVGFQDISPMNRDFILGYEFGYIRQMFHIDQAQSVNFHIELLGHVIGTMLFYSWVDVEIRIPDQTVEDPGWPLLVFKGPRPAPGTTGMEPMISERNRDGKHSEGA